VIAHADDGIGARGRRVLQHQLEGLLARPLAELGIDRDVAPEEGLDARADVGHDVPRADGDAADHAVIGGDAVAVECEGGGHEAARDGHAALLVARGRAGPGLCSSIGRDYTTRAPWPAHSRRPRSPTRWDVSARA